MIQHKDTEETNQSIPAGASKLLQQYFMKVKVSLVFNLLSKNILEGPHS